MDQRYPGADWRPLGEQTEPAIVPRVFIVHTIVGFLRGTETMFKRQGYTGTESTFGIGGPADPPGLDGAVWQWQSLGRQADAQGAGNAYATSVETSDGGLPSRPWSPAQIAALIKLGAWWARQTGAPAALVKSPEGKGFGYHRQFNAWNPNNHSCPGDVRLDQYLKTVIPGIARALKPPAPAPPVKETPGAAYVLRRTLKLGMSGADVKRVQGVVNCKQDGDYGEITEAHVKTWQHGKRLAADGIFGPASAKAAGWRYMA